jgi:hypothetical protein
MKYRAINEAGLCLKCGQPMQKGDLLMENFLGDIHARCHVPKPSQSYQAKKAFEHQLQEYAKRTTRRS